MGAPMHEVRETAAEMYARARQYRLARERMLELLNVVPEISDAQVRATIGTQILEIEECARMWTKRADAARDEERGWR